MKPRIKAIYISVKNMDRAVKFYEDLFETKVSSLDKRMSSFDFDNISFLLFDSSIDGEKVSIGNIVVPDIEKLCRRYLDHLAQCIDERMGYAEHDKYIAEITHIPPNERNPIAKLSAPASRKMASARKVVRLTKRNCVLKINRKVTAFPMPNFQKEPPTAKIFGAMKY